MSQSGCLLIAAFQRAVAPKEDGRKIMTLDTTDAVALLGYAGLGATPNGTEPSDWMSAVLRGRNLPLEQSLGVLAGALQRQLPRHLMRLPSGVVATHNIVIPAFVGSEARLYSIDLAMAPDRKRSAFRYTRHVVDPTGARPNRVPRVGLAGSGAHYLSRDKRWIRRLLTLVRASDRKQISAHAVSDHLAGLNYLTHVNTADGSVGPRSIVVWRHAKSGVYRGGGAHQFYDGLSRQPDSGALPTITNGMDLRALVGAMMPHMLEQFQTLREGQAPFAIDEGAINAALAQLPEHPDENLK